jgi:hypothetical protein
MSADANAQRNGSYAARPVTKAPGWHGLVAWDMLFNNLSTGLFLTAALAELLVPRLFTPLAKAAYPLALVFLLADLALLTLDLGDPLRFHHMLRVFKLTSPMSLGTWCLTAYSLPLTVAAALSLFAGEGSVVEGVRLAAIVLGVLPALGAAIYKGVLFSTSAQPGWKDARWLGCYVANSAFVLGCAVLLALATLLGQERAASVLRPALVVLLVLSAVPLSLLAVDLRPELSRILTPAQFVQLTSFAAGGILLPLGLLLAGQGTFLVLSAVLLLLIARLAQRYLILRLPHAAVQNHTTRHSAG